MPCLAPRPARTSFWRDGSLYALFPCILLVLAETAALWTISARRPTRDDLFGPVRTIAPWVPEAARNLDSVSPTLRKKKIVELRDDVPQRVQELIIEFEELSAADTALSDWNDRDEEQPRIRRFLARIPVGTLDQLVFGGGKNIADGRKQLDLQLTEKVKAVSSAGLLPGVQIRKVELAGRGDIVRFLDRVESLRPAFQQVHICEEVDDSSVLHWGEALAWDAKVLRTALTYGLFEDGSLFAKTLRTSLTAEQFATWTARHSNAAAANR